jgi:hypothetical protein
MRLFEACFQILVDYVEKELAWMQLLSDNKERWHHRIRIPNGRELGLRYLNWEIQLGDDSPEQSAGAQTIKDLYLWYRDLRPLRPDPYDDVPDVEDCRSDEEVTKSYWTAANIEKAYEEEDDRKLNLLISIRGMMWT